MDPENSPSYREGDTVSTHNRVDMTTTLYGQLQGLAKSMMARERNGRTLQATELLHEAWLRLDGEERNRWNDRSHYFAAVAETMRHILVDRARRRQSKRHGGGLQRIDMDPWNWEQVDPTTIEQNDKAILAVNDALDNLTLSDRETAAVIKLHYFVGLSTKETADLLGLSLRTAERRLACARYWMGQEIKEALSA